MKRLFMKRLKRKMEVQKITFNYFACPQPRNWNFFYAMIFFFFCESESYIRPSMVTHTRNSCSAFNPSKVHTHSSEHTHTHREHTPGAVGSQCCGARGADGGSVPCSRAPQSWYWGWRERCTFTPPTYNSCWPGTRTRNLWITSPSL